jgi:hypothetical protein
MRLTHCAVNSAFFLNRQGYWQLHHEDLSSCHLLSTYSGAASVLSTFFLSFFFLSFLPPSLPPSLPSLPPPFFSFFSFETGVSIYSHWPWTHYLPSSASQVLGLQLCATTPGHIVLFKPPNSPLGLCLRCVSSKWYNIAETVMPCLCPEHPAGPHFPDSPAVRWNHVSGFCLMQCKKK